MCTIAHTDAFLERPVEDFERLGAEIKRLERLVEARDREIGRLTDEWNASLGEIDQLRSENEMLLKGCRLSDALLRASQT